MTYPKNLRSILFGAAAGVLTLTLSAVSSLASGPGNKPAVPPGQAKKENKHERCNQPRCRICNPPQATVTYSGRAIVVNLTNIHSGGPAVIRLGDTGALPRTGGQLHASVMETNVASALALQVGDADTQGGDNQARSEVNISGFDLTFLTTNNVSHRLTFSSLQVDASAACSSNGIVLSGGVEIEDLALDGQPITVTGEANQTLSFDGFTLTFNAQTGSVVGNKGTVCIAGILLRVQGCMTGPIGYVHADISCSNNNVPPVQDCSDRVTGGGWILTSCGKKANFGVGGGIKKGKLWGHLTYIDHGTGLKVKAKRVTNYEVIDEVTRLIEFDVTINRKPGTASVLVADKGEPGRDDTFSIALSNGYTNAGTLGGKVCPTTDEAAAAKSQSRHKCCDHVCPNEGNGNGHENDGNDDDRDCRKAGGGNIQLHLKCK